MQKIIISIVILICLATAANSAVRSIKLFNDKMAGFSGAVVMLSGGVYETLARLAQLTNQDEKGALKDYKIPFVKNGYIVFEAE